MLLTFRIHEIRIWSEKEMKLLTAVENVDNRLKFCVIELFGELET